MKNELISAFLNERIAAGDFPSAVYLIAERGEIIFQDALGLAVKTAEVEMPATLDTIYDLASLTKPLVTGLLLAKLIEANEVYLGDEVSKFLRGFYTAEKRRLTVRDLVTHTSGFAAWKPVYLLLQTLSERAFVENPKAEALAAIELEDLQTAARIQVCYSDFNFLTLGFLLEKLHSKPLAEIARSQIFETLALEKTFFNPPENLKDKIAASEFGNFYEKQVCADLGYPVEDFRWRTNLIWGAVHDANSYWLDGDSGHAGLFAAAADVFKIAQQFLPASTTLLEPATCDLFKTNFTRNLNEARSFAFELAATTDSTASTALAENSFGHLGFTGTSLWIEPDSERVFILLTNRTHRALPFVNINSTRRRFHEAATEALDRR